MRFIALPLLLLACLASVRAGEATFPKLAVLRLDEVIRSSKLCNAALDSNRKLKAEAEAKLEEMDKQIKSGETSLQALKEGSDKANEVQEGLQVVKLKQKQYFDRMRAEIDRRTLAGLRESFTAIRGHLKDFCVERGILIVAQQPQPDIVQNNLQEAQLHLGIQSVLYADASLDITDAFLTYSNARFTAEAAKAGGPPAIPAPAPTTEGPAPK
jgi:Skp family chaperone for outer membrane proteins